jgi:hypothetical protein
MGQNEVCHVIQGESTLKAILAELQCARHGTRIINKYVDMWFSSRDFRADTFHLVELRKIGVVDGMDRAR